MVDVLFVAPDLHRGGVGRCVSFIVDATPDMGISCALFLLRGMDNEFDVNNPRVTRGLGCADSRVVFLFGLPLSIWRLIKTVRREQPAVICSHGLLCNLIVSLLRIFTKFRFRSVAFEHNAPSYHYRQNLLGRVKTWLMSHCYPRHDFVVGVSKGVANDLKAMLPGSRERCIHIYNGIDLDAVLQQSTDTTSEAPVRTSSDDAVAEPVLRVVALGRLAPAKGFETLIEAAQLLDDPRVAFDIVGEGPDQVALQKQIDRTQSRSQIRLLGHRNNPFPVVARGNVFVLTSIRESFGNVLIEALALGLPIIATNCPYGPAEILDHGEYGVLVPVGDAPALAEALRKLLADETVRANFAIKGPQRAADFSLEQHCRQVVALFKPLLR
jgi:glycosyltransferase involved in cell wall biosynthesis